MHDDTWDELIDKMTDKLPGMVNEFLQQFQASGFYGQSAVSDQDLRDTAQHALSAILSTVHHGTTSEELTRRATSLGRRRARQGVDLDALEDAIQLDFSIIWQNLKTEGKTQGTEAVATLIEHVNDLFSTVNSYTLHAREAFLKEKARLSRDLRLAHARHLDRLFSPDAIDEKSIDEIAKNLGLEANTRLAVRVFHPVEAEHARVELSAPAASGRLYGHSVDGSYATFWVRSDEELTAQCASTSVFPGVSFDNCSNLRQVRMAIRAANMIFELGIQPQRCESIDTLQWAVAGHALMDLRPEFLAPTCEAITRMRADQDPILATVEDYLTSGSVKRTAELGFCHRNTVVNRLRQFADATGLDVTIPTDAAMALCIVHASTGCASAQVFG